jgi:predicted ferric reductase
MSPGQLTLLMAGMAAGALLAIWVLPAWIPGLTASVAGESPKAYWYLARSSAIVAYLLLWISMVLGVLITNRLARVWPGGPVAYDLHQYASLLGLGFGVFHALILLGDRYLAPTISQIAIPFALNTYQPFWTGVGQLGFYLFAVVALTFYIRRRTGPKFWRWIHFLSYSVYLMILGHAVFSGSDSALPGMSMLYWITAGGLLFVTLYRILAAATSETPARRGAATVDGRQPQ